MRAAPDRLEQHLQRLARCRRCPKMRSAPVIAQAVRSPVVLIGQAPGSREAELGRPFAWTAGRTLFSWLKTIGLDEEAVRSRVYLAAVCRCFPGKNPAGGDRAPDRSEIANCSSWMDAEFALLRPRLVLPVGRLAIARFLDAGRLDAVVGTQHRVAFAGCEVDVIALPHPSGASVWHRIEPGRTLLARALELIAAHPAWYAIRQAPPRPPRRGRA